MPTRIPGPVDLESTLRGGQTFAWDRIDGRYEGVVEGRVVQVRRDGDDAVVEGLPAAAARAYFRLDDDLGEIRERLAADPVVAERMARWPGLRIVRTDPWECLVSFLLSQNSNVARITRNLRDLASALGEPVGSRHAVPGAEALLDAGERRLRDLGVGYRAPYLIAAARRVADGRLDLDKLREADRATARDALLSVPGVGPKVVECVLLFSLDDLSAFPVDRWVARSLAELYPDAPDRPDAARGFARDRFGDVAGYAQQFLFHDRREAGR